MFRSIIGDSHEAESKSGGQKMAQLLDELNFYTP